MHLQGLCLLCLFYRCLYPFGFTSTDVVDVTHMLVRLAANLSAQHCRRSSRRCSDRAIRSRLSRRLRYRRIAEKGAQCLWKAVWGLTRLMVGQSVPGQAINRNQHEWQGCVCRLRHWRRRSELRLGPRRRRQRERTKAVPPQARTSRPMHRGRAGSHRAGVRGRTTRAGPRSARRSRARREAPARGARRPAAMSRSTCAQTLTASAASRRPCDSAEPSRQASRASNANRPSPTPESTASTDVTSIQGAGAWWARSGADQDRILVPSPRAGKAPVVHEARQSAPPTPRQTLPIGSKTAARRTGP